MTGQLPFRTSKDPLETMNRQITDFLEDPYEHGVSPQTSQLLENMMMKDRKDRPASWAEVCQDIELVTNGQPPSSCAHSSAVSTLLRSEARNKVPAPAAPVLKKKAAPPPAAETPKAVKPAQRIVLTAEEKQALSHLPKKKRSVWTSLFLQLATLSLLAAGTYATLRIIRPDLDPFKPKDTALPRLSQEQLPPRSQYQSDVQPTTATSTRPAKTTRYDSGPAHTVSRTSSSTQRRRGAVDWHDPEFVRAVEHYNKAIQRFEPVRKGQVEADLPVVEKAETDCIEAIRLFQACKSRAPEDVPIDRYIRDTNRILSDIRFILRGL